MNTKTNPSGAGYVLKSMNLKEGNNGLFTTPLPLKRNSRFNNPMGRSSDGSYTHSPSQ